MASTLVLEEYNTSSSVSTVATNINFGSNNSANLVNNLYPVTAGTNSYEKWFKLKFTGTFSSISNVKVYKSSGDYVTGETLKYSGTETTWATPTQTTSTVATTDIPTSEPSTANVSINGDVGNSITVENGTTDFIVLQNQISSNASAGQTNNKVITFSWTET